MDLSINEMIEDEIRTRIRLYDFSTGKQTFFQWQAGMLPALEGKRVLELGCGNGDLWRALLPRWQNCELTLTDVSAQMVASAQQNLQPLADMTAQLNFDVVDFNKLPYRAGEFDIVIANHNLFYADDVDAVLASIAELLAPGGRLVCSTIGADHLHELASLIRTLKADVSWSAADWADVFGLENGSDRLAASFQYVDQFEYDNNLHVSSIEPLLGYLKKAMKGCLLDWVNEHEAQIVELLSPVIAEQGYLRLTPHSGFFIAQKSG